jgi:hypothetical protein
MLMQKWYTSGSVWFCLLSFPPSSGSLILNRSCPIAIGVTDSTLRLVIGSLDKFPVALWSISFPYADLQLSEGVRGKNTCALLAVCNGVILNVEAIGVSELYSATAKSFLGRAFLEMAAMVAMVKIVYFYMNRMKLEHN